MMPFAVARACVCARTRARARARDAPISSSTDAPDDMKRFCSRTAVRRALRATTDAHARNMMSTGGVVTPRDTFLGGFDRGGVTSG